ncbi:MAG: xanthine dehydrogenase family protein molybdopterin-binding subunit [Nitrospiraceae bacterium]|nr:xanthine dehydrogenase family protein molybdopterin-binding subunit [Nitrospiraceae bacterium]
MDLNQRLNVTKIGTGSVSENSLSRRTFLKVSAAAGGGLLLSFILPRTISSRETAGATTVFVPNAFIRIGRGGCVTLIMPYVEMGQGTYTSIPMLIAEELEVDLTQVTLEAAPPDERHYANSIFQIQATGGSTSVRAAWEPLRLAGATARMMLVSAAAQNWKVDPTACHAEKGEVIHATSGRRLKYGALVDTVAMLPIPDRVVLKAHENFTLIGTSAKRLDTPDKVNGKAQFSIDVMIPGMKIATVAACPVFGGRLVGVDDSNAKRIKGVHQVVLLDNAVAVIADHMWAAKQGLAALDIQWDEGPNATLSSAEIIRQLETALLKPGVIARKDGDVAKAMAGAAMKIEALYQMPFLAHATMEPLSCTVHVRKNGCDVWVGSQVLARAQATAAEVTGLPLEKILVHNQLLGGGFGRRLEVDFITQAVQIAKQVDGPVKVIWTREEDIQHDIYRPYYYDRMVAGLDKSGMPVAWSHRSAGSSIYARWHPPAFKDGLDPDVLEGAAEPPPPYALPNMLVEYVRQEPPGIPTGFWRGVGPTHNVFVVESFIDELAAAAKKDPVEYRRALLGTSPRAKAVLELAAEKAGWGQPLPEGRGRGVSVQFVFGSYVAQVAEVQVDKNGEVRVTRVVCAVDCGVVVNPDTVKAQMEGGIMFGLAAALFSEITVKNGRVEQSNFNDYRMLRINEAPAIDVYLVKSGEAPGGIGEPGTSALAPALTNAIFAATGTRIRKLPVNRVELRSAKL